MTEDTASLSASRRYALDAYLVVAAQSGDRRALDALVRRWHPRLVAHAWRLTGDRGQAEDAAQAAWLDIVRALPGLRDEAAFPAWAYRITTRKAGAGIGDRIVERRIAEAAGAEPAPISDDPGTGIEQAYLRRAVAHLPPGHRAAVALHYFEGLGIAEIAVALGVPAGTIKTRLMHARARLKSAFQGEDHD